MPRPRRSLEATTRKVNDTLKSDDPSWPTSPDDTLESNELTGGSLTSTDDSPRADSFLRDVAAMPVVAPPQTEQARVGERLGHYVLRSRLGRGGMGVVYLAYDVRLRRRVALKVLPDHLANDAARRQLFMREARSASAVHHPNIATVFEVGQCGQTLYLAMEYVAGRTLRAVLDDAGGKLDVSDTLRLGVQIARALGHAHDAGIVHRDIKPENVMLTSAGVVKVLDFGLAKTVDPEAARAAIEEADSAAGDSFASRTGHDVMGTPGYMSPEQSSSLAVDARTDVFSVGVVLIEMLSGVAPRRAKQPAAERAHQHAPPRLARVLERSVRHSAVDRFPTCSEFVVELERVEADLARAASRRPWRLPVAVASAVCLGIGALAWWSGSARAPVPTSAAPSESLHTTLETSAPAQAAPSPPGAASDRVDSAPPAAVSAASVASAAPVLQPSAAIVIDPAATRDAKVTPPDATPKRSARVRGLVTNNLYAPESLSAAASSILGSVGSCFSSPDPAVAKTTFNFYTVHIDATGKVTGGAAAAEAVPALDGCVVAALRTMRLGPTLTGEGGDVSIGFGAR